MMDHKTCFFNSLLNFFKTNYYSYVDINLFHMKKIIFFAQNK